MSGQSGVGIRLYVNGDQVVRRTFDQISDSGRKMWTQIALGERSANPAIRSLSAGVGEARGAIEGFASRAGIAGTALGGFGVAGLAASVAVAGFVASLGQAREAMRFADELDDTATRLGIGTTALQQYRYAMIAVGGSAEDADQALEGFTRKLGEAQAGGRSLAWFERLGFSREQLQSYSTAEEALGDVVDRLAGLNKETERQAVASKIGLAPMIALAREGREGVERLLQAAVELGYVMDEELVAGGAEANRKFEEMSTIIDVQLKSAFVSLAPVILELADFMVYLANKIAEVADAWREIEDRSSRGLRQQDERLAAQQIQLLRGRTSPSELTGFDLRAWNNINEARGRIASELADRGRSDPDRPRPNDLEDPSGRPRGASGSQSRAAADRERRIADIDRARERLEREELTARRDAARHRWSDDTPEARAQLAQSLLALEIQERDEKRRVMLAELERLGAIDEATQLNLEQLELLDRETDQLRQREIAQTLLKEQAEERLQREEDAERHAIALLDIQAQMTGDARERYEIGRRIVLAEQALERKLLEATLRADGLLDEEDLATLQRLQERQTAQLNLFDYNEQERLREQFKGYGREIVQAIEDGRIGEYIGDKIKERLLDGALEALFNQLNAGGRSGGGGGFWSDLLSIGSNLFSRGGSGGMNKLPQKLGGKAAGGDARAGVFYGMAEHGPELLLLGGKGQVTSAAETARMVQSLAGPGDGRAVTVHAVYAPNISVKGSGPEIDALRRELAAERAQFRSNVIETVADARERRIL